MVEYQAPMAEGRRIHETTARVLVEHAVAGLKKGAAQLEDFGADDTAEVMTETVWNGLV